MYLIFYNAKDNSVGQFLKLFCIFTTYFSVPRKYLKRNVAQFYFVKTLHVLNLILLKMDITNFALIYVFMRSFANLVKNFTYYKELNKISIKWLMVIEVIRMLIKICVIHLK